LIPAAVRVGVFPAGEMERRGALLAALESAFPVRFEGREAGERRDLGAVLDLGDGSQAAAAAATGTPALSLAREEPAEDGEPLDQELSDSAQLDRRLRGARLPDRRLGAALGGGGLEAPAAAAVLAGHGDEATWVREDELRRALLVPSELNAGEALRERLRDGRSAALLPLVHFLRELTAGPGWQPPPVRATVLFDDPNLHWPSYGFVRLGALGRHAREHGYHAALATVPLDGWFAHPRAVKVMRESEGALSLVVHGNDHFGAELGRLATEAEALALAAQASRRGDAFFRRAGVAIESVMVPPHEECSAPTPGALRRCGFEAVTMTRPYPWLARPPRSWLTRPDRVGPLAGWRSLDFAAGLPVFLRHPFVGRSPAELTLRAFLDQPLILYGHQADLAQGLDVLADSAADVNRLGSVRWCSLGEIAAGSYETRRQDAELSVRLQSNGVRVEIPAGVERLTVTPPAPDPERPAADLLVDGRPQAFDETLEVTAGARLDLRLRVGDEVDVASIPAPRRQPLALPRRLLSEGRDRLAPLLTRAG
jgi:hypothetical protein